MADDFPSLYNPPAAAGSGQGSGSGPTPSSAPTAAAALEQMHAAQSQSQSGGEASGSGSNNNQQNGTGTGTANGTRPAAGIDLGNEELFPSLGAPSAPPGKGKASTAGGWGAAASAARNNRAAVAASTAAAASNATPLHTENITLPTASISVAPVQQQRGGFSNAPQEATTLGGVLGQLMQKFQGTKVEASSSTARGTTTFLLKAARQQDLERVKRELMARIVKKVNETLQVPASTRAFIIGAKGRTLKSITEETGVNIQIPRDAGVSASAAPVSDEPTYADDEEAEIEDPLIPINLYGDHPSVQAAKQRILAIVNERTSRLSTKVTTVPQELYHLLSDKLAKGELVPEQDQGNVEIRIPPVWKFRAGAGRGASANDASASEGNGENEGIKEERDNSIHVSGDREAVTRAVEAITSTASELSRTTQTLSMTLSKRQHRFILPPVSDQILSATSCSVEVPPSSSPSDQITIRGPSSQLVEALQLVMQKANAASVETIDLSSIHGINTPKGYVKQVSRYLLQKSKLRKIADEEQGTQIYIPRGMDEHTTIDIVATQGAQGQGQGGKGPKEAVANARNKVVEVLKTLPPNVFDTVQVDPLVHRFLIGRKGSKISSFEEKNAVQVVFPNQHSQSSSTSSTSAEAEEDAKNILLVYVGSDSSNSKQVLSQVKDEIQKLAAEAADITSTTLKIPSKLHRFIIGPSGTTLNALTGTGEERIVNVKFGSSASGAKDKTNGAKEMADEDEVVIRGPSDEVKKVAGEIERIAEEAKNDEIVNSYTVDFEIEQRFVSHIVGKGGAGVQKLRDDLGVRIDFGDSASASSSTAAAAADGSTTVKAKKSSSTSAKTGSKSLVKIQGRKENVEEAKKRVLRQVDQLADETTLSVPLLSGLERGSLIGKQGTYVQRLETKYEVRINFPRANDEGVRDDVITIRGGKKGAEGAKKELVELMEYEKENSQTATLTVPARALPRIFGKQGTAIRELQDETSTEIDVSKNNPNDPSASGSITIKGTKAAVASAKKALQAIVAEVQDESTFEMEIERQYHVNIIGKGGQNIRELIARCGGPEDSKTAGQMVRFPRAGEGNDTVTIRAPSSIATKIKDEIEKQVASLKDRVVYGVAVPQSSHARLIGRGGAGVNELQRKHNVKIVLSNWSEFKNSGELVNKEEIGDAADTDIIKIIGSQSAAEAAAAEIKERVAAAPSSGGQGGGAGANRQQRQQQQQQPANEGITQTVNVPSHLHTRITQGGKFFRTLPNGIRIDHGDVNPPSSTAGKSGARTNGAGSSAARIDEDPSEDSDFHWEITQLSSEDNADSEEIPWNIKGNDQAKVDRVEAMIVSALERCKNETHQGVLTVPQSLIPRIVGRQGSGLDKLRAAGVSAEVEGRQGANSVIFMGTPENLEKAREMVVELSQNQRNFSR